MSKCQRCVERGKPNNYADDPKCAFENGVFTTDNWNCATMNILRGIVCYYREERRYMAWYSRDDNSAASLGVLRIPENDTVPGYLVMSFYKDRGRTGQAYIMNDDYEPHPVTLDEAEAIILAMKKDAE